MSEPVFQTSFQLMKFGDCPVCLGDALRCPTPQVPMSACRMRRGAIRHMLKRMKKDLIAC